MGGQAKPSDRLTLYSRFSDMDDTLKLIIMTGVWLTGPAFSLLHTVYICQSLSNNLLQHIVGNVSQVSQGKKDALIVDYFGNTNIFSQGWDGIPVDITKPVSK
jgi:hypothetical protein